MYGREQKKKTHKSIEKQNKTLGKGLKNKDKTMHNYEWKINYG